MLGEWVAAPGSPWARVRHLNPFEVTQETRRPRTKIGRRRSMKIQQALVAAMIAVLGLNITIAGLTGGLLGAEDLWSLVSSNLA